MDKEKMNKINALYTEIEDLKRHIEDVELARKNNAGLMTNRFFYKKDSRNTYDTEMSAMLLKSEFYNREEFYILYLLRAKQHLADLEKQYADL